MQMVKKNIGIVPIQAGWQNKGDFREIPTLTAPIPPMAKDKDSHFIPGIYNYCDRWCERCAFTHRCRVYSTQQEFEEQISEDRTEHNQAFWDQLEKFSEDSSDEWKAFPPSAEDKDEDEEEEAEGIAGVDRD